MDTDSQKSTDHTRTVPWIACASVAVAALGLVAYLKSCQSADKVTQLGKQTIKVIDDGVKAAPEFAAKFKTGTIQHTFVDHVTSVIPTKGNLLELATIESNESFERQDTKRVFWDVINLGTTTSKIRCPVTFRYHLQLSDQWRLATRDHVCLVLAPAIQPSQPPAIHTDQLEKESNEDWLRFNGDENLAELERSITPELEKRAADRNHQKLVREACRQKVGEFVKNWLLKEDGWSEDQLSAVVVVFPDELKVDSDQTLEQYQHDPTVRLDRKN